MSEQVGTYTLDLHCHNCGDVRAYEIDKGERIVSAPCENCGVKQLKRVEYYLAKELNRQREGDDESEM